MIISNSRKFIFVHTAKTAGDSITEALTPYLRASDFVVRNDFQIWLRRLRRQDPPAFASLAKHSPAVEIRAAVTPEVWDASYKFAFVRHPFDRTVSFYNFMKKKARDRHRPQLRNLWYAMPPGRPGDPRNWPGGRAYAATSSFSEFIRHPAVDAAAGMQPQAKFVCDDDGRLIVDFVGRFEQLAADFGIVQDAIGVPRGPLPRRNSSAGRSGRAELSTEDRAYLAERFADDFVRFEYDA
ncbi:MAG: sulfotransferase family 2 domain-containing protein [Acidimicrobiales bacterium]